MGKALWFFIGTTEPAHSFVDKSEANRLHLREKLFSAGKGFSACPKINKAVSVRVRQGKFIP